MSFRYYVIQDGVLTGYDDWDSAAEHYIGARGKAQIAEVIPVKLAVVPAVGKRGKQQKTNRSGIARERLLAGDPPMRVCEELGLSRQAVYNVRTALVKEGLLPPIYRKRNEVRP